MTIRPCSVLAIAAALGGSLACGHGNPGVPPPQTGGGAGSAGGGSGGPSGWSAACGPRVSQPPGPAAAPYCPPLAEVAAWIVGPPECPDQVIPTERELACNAALLPRRALPATIVTTELDWAHLSDRADGSRLYAQGSARYIFDLTDALDDAGVPRDQVSPGITGLPPFFQFRGPGQTVDLATELPTLEASLRSYGAHVLRERAKGKLGFFAYGLGPHEPQPPSTGSAADVEAAIRDVMAPRVEAAAKVAELVNAEVLLPFPGEADILANLPGVRELPASERLRLVQLLVDTVRTSARKHFTGKLMGASAWRYYPADHPLYGAVDMSQISWAGFDLVEFTLLIATNDHCDAAFTTAFMAAQTARIDQMAQRDHFGWGSAELDLFTFDSLSSVTGTGGCTTPPRQAYFPVLDALLQGFLDAPSRPAFLNFTQGPGAWAGDAAFQAELRGKLTGFSGAIKTAR